MQNFTRPRRTFKTPGSSPDANDIRWGVENLGRETITLTSYHPERFRHPFEHVKFVVPPGQFCELPHRLYTPTVPSGGDMKVGIFMGADLKRAKSEHSARFVYRID